MNRIICFGCIVLCVFLAASTGIGQQPSDSERSAPRLPAALPDGRPLRPIALFLSQMDELIPDNYRPVSIQQLNEAIGRLTDLATDYKASRLKSAVYWVEVQDGMLVSERSTIDIESDSASEVRRSLGKVNLAIEATEDRNSVAPYNAPPRLESDADGNLLAVFPGGAETGSTIEFRWRLHGQLSATGHDYTLQLPRTPQTRIVFSVPETLTLEALDGVLRNRPGPPPDVDETTGNRRASWYELDAGGLSRIRLRTRQQPQVTDRGRFAVRRSSIQFEVDSGGLTWTSRMVVQLPLDLRVPPLQVAGTTITSVKVNGTDVSFNSKFLTDQLRQLELEMPTGFNDSENATVNFTISGYSTRPTEFGWCDLPKPVWIGENIVQASVVDEAQLSVNDPLRVIEWKLPAQWKQTQQQRLESGVTLFSAEGPPIQQELMSGPRVANSIGESVKAQDPISGDQKALSDGEAELSDTSPGDQPVASSIESSAGPWSRVRLTQVTDLLATDTKLRLEVGSGLLLAKASLNIKMDPSRVEPLRLRWEPKWSIESVTFTHSGRVVENAGLNEQSKVLELWPEVEDAEDGRIVLEVTGSRSINSAASRGGFIIPSTWFVRIVEARGRLLAAIVPPTNLNWSGEAAMERGRRKEPQLSDPEKQFFGVMSPKTLWFQNNAGRTPRVLLKVPSVSYNAATVLGLRSEDGDVIEELTVSVDSQSESLTELVVHTGPANQRPDYSWSIVGEETGPAINLPSTDVDLGSGDDEGVYTVDVTDISLRDRRLVARRRYPVEGDFRLQLPSVPGAASQDSEVLIDADLMVKERPGSVQLVPLNREDLIEDLSDLFSSPDRDGDAETQVSGRGWTRLRYDAVGQPSITIAEVENNPDVTIVWRERVRLVASSRGTDQIEATYTVSPAAPFRIETDADLQLISISRDGEMVDLANLPQRPIVLQPRFRTEEIRVIWDRRQFGSTWLRRCRMPRLKVSGTVLRSEYSLDSSSDTVAPAALLAGNAVVGNAIKMRPGETTILLRRNTALAIGWLSAMLIFALGWYIAERNPLMIVALLVLASTILLLWWPWRMALIGWLIIPLIAAAMLSTSKVWGRRFEQSVNLAGKGGDVLNVGVSPEDKSLDFSVDQVLRSAILWILVLSGAGAASIAQETNSSNDPDRLGAVNVLIPVLGDGKPSGEMVYIPNSVFTELFPTTSDTLPQTARFQSADYRVRVNPNESEPDQLIFSGVEAEYKIHIADGDRNTNLVRLPLNSTDIRRIETIDEVSRIVPFEIDSMGRVIAALPPGESFRIRVTFRPMVTQVDQWLRLYLDIPQVASSRLTIESEQNVDAIRLGGASGRLLSEEAELLRRWEEDLGPTPSLQVDVRVNQGGESIESNALRRRYWVHAGKRQVTIDCEVDPPYSIAAGETFQFVVRDSAMPYVISPSWRFSGSELYSPARRLITLKSTRATPGPIRLLWTQPIELNQQDPSIGTAIRIPEVIAAALGANADAWIALHCESSLEFEPLTRDNIEPLSVDQFLAAWSGYRGRIDRALVPIEELPSPILRFRRSSRSKVDQSHHLHVMPNRLELNYKATLVPSDLNRDLYRLRVPGSIDLKSLLVNGNEVVEQPLRSNGFQEWLLGDFVGLEPVEIEAFAIQTLKPMVSYSPPRFSISPDVFTEDRYRITRDQATRLSVVEEPILAPIQANELAPADSLANGWIPVSTWRTASDSSPRYGENPGGEFLTEAKETRFDCDQLIVLNRDDSQWSMETFLKFGRRIPDFIDIEVPASWCEYLEVIPATALSRQQAIDPSRQVVRIRCDESALVDNTLSIRGKSTSNETGRLSVPSVRVLGFGQRRIHICVPNRLDDEPVQWRTSAVEGDDLPEPWRALANRESHSTYVAANPSWSIDQAPLPDVDSEALALSFDAQAFPQEEVVLVMCHWDLLPGNLETIEISLPSKVSCVGAWSAGKAVIPKVTEKSSDKIANQQRLQIPLALSRLSQPIEVLIRVPASVVKRGDYLPALVGVPVTRSWLTNYVPTESSALIWGGDDQQNDKRALSLANAVVDSMEAVEFINQRPREEVVTWLRLWIARYMMIAESAGHTSFFERRLTDDAPATFEPSSMDSEGTGAGIDLPSHLQWEILDSRMAAYSERFLADLSSTPLDELQQGVFLFGISGFDGFLPGKVSESFDAVAPRVAQSFLRRDRELRALLVNGLSLMLVCGLLVCFRGFGRIVLPVATHPAFWLGLLGLFGFAVAPVPVAAALIVVSISLPVLPHSRDTRSRSVL